MLKILISLPILGIFLNNIVNEIYKNKNKSVIFNIISMIITILVLFLSLWIYLTMNNNNNEYQYRDIIDLYYTKISIGLDGVSISVILIITLIFPIIMLLKDREIQNNTSTKNIANILLFMESILIFIFISLDILFFFIMFELILIPMFIIIGKYGSRVNKIEAAYRFLIYTMIGSLVMLISILIIYLKYGTTNIEIINYKLLDILYFNTTNIFLIQILWVFIFFSFMIKIPMFPFHTWLPEAHTEAPTIGSIILAAILLKLGTFGIYRYSFSLFNLDGNISNIYNYFLPIIFILSILSIFYGSFIAIRSIDLKKIIAYSSIVHMNFSIFGFFSQDLMGLSGTSFLMFSHAFISSSLFLLIGILYKRYHSRILSYYKGLVLTMPLFSSFFLFFSLANISLPFTSSFISEIFILISSFKLNFFISILLTSSLIFSSSYVIFLANRILFGNLSSSISHFLDLSITEFLALFSMFLLTLLLGLYPKPLLDLFSLNLINILY